MRFIITYRFRYEFGDGPVFVSDREEFDATSWSYALAWGLERAKSRGQELHQIKEVPDGAES